MYETVSVDEALARGQRMVNYPILVIMIGTMGGILYLCTQEILPQWFAGFGIITGIAAGWIYWSFMITRWKLWAFYNVRNVHELKTRAIKQQLIWPDNNFFGKTEIWTPGQKRQWTTLQDKFELDDVFLEDFRVSAETIIRYSPNKALGTIIIGVSLLCTSIYLFLYTDQSLAGAITVVVGILLLISGFKHFRNKTPQIILSNLGIETAGMPLHRWEEITGEETRMEETGDSKSAYLVYNCLDGEIKVEINELDIKTPDLDRLLLAYRKRSLKRKK